MHLTVLPASRVRRLRETIKHPDQAAIAARLPIVGRRVPMQSFWRRRPVRPGRVLRHGRDEARHAASIALERSAPVAQQLLARGRNEADAVRSAAITRGRPVARRAIARGRNEADAVRSTAMARSGPVVRRISRNPATFIMLALGVGAFLMYWLDPQQGRRRRALVRDRLAHTRKRVTRGLPRTAERRGRFLRGVAKGIQHDAASVMHRNGHTPTDDDVLVARVRSEALRGTGVRAGEIHVEAYEGCVTLRGQIGDTGEIDRIVKSTKHIDGVREVRNYLHTPGTPPPNKGDVYEHVPSHMAGGMGRLN